MAEVENKLARSLLDNEMLKGPMLDLKKSILQKQKIIDDKESSLKALEKEIRETRYTCRTFQTKIEVKKQTIEELTKKHEQKVFYFIFLIVYFLCIKKCQLLKFVTKRIIYRTIPSYDTSFIVIRSY